ncbi:MAG: hypothetical protein R3A47_08550 [Polyangiales bacterium]
MKCVSLRFFPRLALQIALRQRPHWRGSPVAIVDNDGPQGRIVLLNEQAKHQRLEIGMLHSTGRHIVPTLRTAVIDKNATATQNEDFCRSLQLFSPKVEPSDTIDGAFFLDPQGLQKIFGDEITWCKSILRYLHAQQWTAAVGVGFCRYRLLAIASQNKNIWISKSQTHENDQANKTPLEYLDLQAHLHQELRLLGIRTLGDLLKIPPAEMQNRYGLKEFYLRFSDLSPLPLQPVFFESPVQIYLPIEPPDDDRTRLLFVIKRGLHDLIKAVVSRANSLKGLLLRFGLDHAPEHLESIYPATPTCDETALIELVRLRLEQTLLEQKVESITLQAIVLKHHFEQENFESHHAKRDLHAADRALARIAAAYGPRVVTRASLKESHLPEVGFFWEQAKNVVFPNHVSSHSFFLIRRLYARPKPLLSRFDSNKTPIPLLRGDEITELYGPHRVSGGWWKRQVERDYYYATTTKGALLWIFYDRPRRQWFVHGELD